MAPKTFLIVDDDPLRLALTIGMIEDCGAVAMGAPNGERAQRLIAASGHEIGVLITDVRMPGSLDGISLARWTRENWPNIRVYVVSGYDQNPSSMPEGVVFLPKVWLSHDVIKFVLSEGSSS